jgi:membrane fusion protein (multidrug efflux system)
MKTIVLLAGVALSACTPRDQGTSEPAPASSAAATATLEVVPVVSRQSESSTHLEGELAPYESVALFSKAGGFVSKVSVDRGSAVKEGQVLIVISAPELAAQRAEAEAKLEADRSTFERFKAASQTPGAVAGHELELQQSAVHADEAKVQSLHALEQYLVVRAPFDGMVTERNIHPGAFVGPATSDKTPMLRIEQVAKLRLTVAVPERFVGEVADGTAATFAVSTWPGEKFTGVVRRSSHSVDPRTRTMAVELDVDNAAGRLTPGMFVSVEWSLKRPAPSLWVPPTAIVQSTEKTFIVRVRDGTVDQVSVQRGSATPDLVEVFGALEAGDFIARRGSEELRAGMHVETRTVAAAPSSSAK